MNKDQFILEKLKRYYGVDSYFRDGQLEAIKAVLENKKILVVQKTGWGKSLVYFLATRILRDKSKGPTIVISPLLSLINNQIDSTNKFNLISKTINSNNKKEWPNIYQNLIKNNIDVLFISPERLANEEFIHNVLGQMKQNIGLLVVDEAHCISDWGHDFRPDYRRILNVVQNLPKNVPLLATTATANNRVIKDIQSQLGNDITVLRGELTRESIIINIIELDTQAERLAWLYENINKLPGTGIIYCLTQRDCNLISEWLKQKDINVEAYHAGFKAEERLEKEQKLINNEVKALAATVALGMGFDKPDIGFVIHFQRPANVIAYYQQIGRAGRNLKISYAILLVGQEDEDIIKYFIDSAFPTQLEMQEVIKVIEDNEGLKLKELQKELNMKASRIEKCLKSLEIENAIYKENNRYYRSLNDWIPNIKYTNVITQIRKDEVEHMKEYIKTDKCYMEFIAKELDDEKAKRCGKCGNCQGNIFTSVIKQKNIEEAVNYIKSNYLIIEPRKQWPIGLFPKSNIPVEQRMEQGIVLSTYGDSGWGKIVRDGKYKDNYFSNELVDASYQILKNKVKEWEISGVIPIPSLKHPTLVKNFSERLARKLGLFYYDNIIYKKEDTPQQKTLENSYKQCQNVIKGFEVMAEVQGNILLIDDMVDSRWTLVYCAYLLKINGANKVYPFALAKTTEIESGN